MREIKFRARHAGVPIGWIYGYFMVENGLCHIINEDGKFKVVARTECQYTGLKEKNGKEIYEGDVMKSDGGRVRQVIFNKFTGGYRFDSGADLMPAATEFEIIGNIYENPELLEVKP